MTSGTKTTNLQLTQYVTGDTIDYFAEYNTDMAKIDAAVAAKSSVIILDSGESFPAEPQAGAIYFKVEGTDTQGNGIQIMDEDGQAYLSMSLAKYVKLSDGTTLEAKLATVASKDVVTTSTNGLMSASDKAKLDGIAQRQRLCASIHPSIQHDHRAGRGAGGEAGCFGGKRFWQFGGCRDSQCNRSTDQSK